LPVPPLIQDLGAAPIDPIPRPLGAGRSLREAAVDFYHQSWRLAALNTALSAVVLAIVYLIVWVLPVLAVLLVLVGPLAAALMHCAVKLAQEDELRFGDVVTGLRLHWRRGLVLAAVDLAAVVLGVIALRFYGTEHWLFTILVVDVLVVFALVQLVLWPRVVFERERPLGQLVGEALADFLGRPLATIGFALALLVVNLLGVVAGVLPLLTLTIAYSFVATAHFALPRSELREPLPYT
jgi:hypothetical protein